MELKKMKGLFMHTREPAIERNKYQESKL